MQAAMNHSRRLLLTAALAGCATRTAAQVQDPFAAARSRLVREIEADMRATGSSTGRAQLSDAVRRAMSIVPRHRFVPPSLADQAYRNHPLAIGHGQTISQPFIVALMTELLDPKSTDRALEVGTGSGYQAAVLAELVGEVKTIEIVAPLGERAKALLAELGYRNVEVRIGDGYLGWPDAAPFDAIIVTAAPDKVPQPLIDQLKPGGRMVVPVGPQGIGGQDLLLIRRQSDGRTVTRKVLPVRFVPLTRERGK
jgi:protein-L-isoaspartate(D-aspartate) O-methyltransferase